jgi:signal transduction histidine kinase
MRTLINDLLTYSHINETERKFENSNLDTIIKDVLVSMKEEMQDKQAKIEVGKLYRMNIIPFQFRQLFQNLISNSLKFSKPGLKPHIIINCNFIKYEASNTKKFILKADYYHVSFSDNGIGFDPEYKHKIFEIFQQLHEKDTYKGTGIGLAIVKKIVENHNGIITANSKINKGATFDIYIPADLKQMI